MACASGLSSLAQACMLVEGGHADVVIAGGSDSVSNAEVPLPRSVTHGMMMAQKKGIMGFFKEAGYNPSKWFPSGVALTERSTGKTMGWHGDVIAELNNISRKDQEALAVVSHANAFLAEKAGYFKDEVVPVTVDKGGRKTEVMRDDVLQRDTDKMKSKMPTLKPTFRKDKGTITAATSSALTDGGSAMLVMSEEKAKKLGYQTDVSVKSWYFSGIDPYPQLLLAPVLGWGPALKRACLTPKDIDLYEIHEAFAAQVLATIKCLRSQEFFNRYASGSKPVLTEDIDRSKLNVNGGSLALGHPFAATGGRIVTSLANELRRSGKRHGLVSICAAGDFAAQVLATIKCLRSQEFFNRYASGSKPVLTEDIDRSKLNVNGGSLALGHPFAATGGRIVTSLANELRRSGKRHGLVSICAAGVSVVLPF
ncbi:Beta-ketoacyl synthase, N-terminal domain/Thiolase, N-terminal domain [Leishmania naiffi]|uniref:Beta-ketoacyl synthase, N-terminal domain/Thiolase, N-terminal domain n=1 Tax=Leishmania naiffi TaxID=5678 RepID=A0AAW3BCW0_9TRYP